MNLRGGHNGTLVSGATRLRRRRFLRGVAACALAPAGMGVGPGCTAPTGARSTPGGFWVAAHGATGGGAFGLVAVPSEGSPEAASAQHSEPGRIPTGFRGHDVAAHPLIPGLVALFGRRPATRSAVVDILRRRVVAMIEAQPGRAFQGHGFFTPDGRLLVTTEADTLTGEGKLGLRETETFSFVAELDTHGIGPHEAQIMPDAATVVVANGGLLTRPETGRQVLNLDSMDSSLSYLALASGELLEQRRVAEPKSSIRHLDVAQDGTVAFGVQVQREALDHEEVVPLAGTHRRGGEVQLFAHGHEYLPLMNDYVGSVALCSQTRVAGFTSPRGDIALFWHADSGELVGVHRLADCSGLAVASDGGHFVLSSSLGEVRVLSTTDLVEDRGARQRFEGLQWDNHLIEVAVDREQA